MRHSSFLTLGMAALSLLLSGCKEPLFDLHYALPVDHSRLGFLKAFRADIEDTISAQGLDPAAFDLDDMDGDNAIRVSGSVSPEQAEALEKTFRDRLARRPAEPLTVTVKLNDSPQSLEEGEAGKQLFGDEHQLQFRVGGALITHPGLSMADLIEAVEAKTDPGTRAVEVRCNISAPLMQDTPLYAVDFSRGALRARQVDVSAGRGLYRYDGTLLFDDTNLQALYESGRLDFRGDVDTSSSNARFRHKTLGLMFDLGPLSEVELTSDKASSLSVARLESACRQRALALGEPFTFYFGTGLDRLTALTEVE